MITLCIHVHVLTIALSPYHHTIIRAAFVCVFRISSEVL